MVAQDAPLTLTDLHSDRIEPGDVRAQCPVERGQAILLANPELLSAGKEMREYPEASPNLPGVSAVLKRPAKVSVRFLNADGVWDRQDFEGLWATSVQHQIDHLNGKMFFDHLSRTRRAMLLKKAKKQA